MKINEIKKENINIGSGIYIILNTINGRVYIGSSHNIYSRFQSHKSKLLNNKHENQYLQNAWNKHGRDSFDFQIVKECLIEDLFREEQKLFEKYSNTYNLRKIIESNRGHTWKLSKELVKKWSDVKKGKIPKNLGYIQQKHKRKVVFYIDNSIVKIFNSCEEGANYFNMKPNLFNQYIGKQRKGKYFKENEKIEYYGD